MQVSRVKPEEWHLHRFRDTVATRWLLVGIDVRTVQVWLGHESLATTQKYLEPSKETQEQLDRMKLPFYEPVERDTDTLRVLGGGSCFRQYICRMRHDQSVSNLCR
ncbi:MAG: hypothetical protein DMG70_13225 [Acidobacteria bacterium]|nr:MAG: hypothetical protein DMG70_13225 [Acidobacteriota bacterium]PYY07510.1 MAG: hypothetical protein DMG69_18780 [Acidobacteriota bacterium]